MENLDNRRLDNRVSTVVSSGTYFVIFCCKLDPAQSPLLNATY